MSIIDKLGKELIVFDGAMGTLIQSEVESVKIADELNITRPDLMKKIHEMYVEAGADVITTNTFNSNEYKFENYSYTVEEVITAGVENARAVSKDRWVALDIGPVGQLMEPYGTMTFDEVYDAFKRQVVAGAKAGCDLILIETMSDINEARAAVLAAKENTDLPVLCTMTFSEHGRTFLGVEPVAMTEVLQGLGVDGLGVNCSVGPESLLPIVQTILKYSYVPVLVQPNAGMPVLNEKGNYYQVNERDFACQIKKMVDLGVAAVGGCCGTNPDYIREIKKVVKKNNR